MDSNNLDRLCVVLIFLVIVIGFSSSVAAESFSDNNDQEAWIKENSSSLLFTYLEANIHLIIKNNNDHAEYFKISQQYSGDGTVTPSITWKVVSAPGAVKMAKNINSPADLGWKVNAGETKDVSFKLVSNSTPFYIVMGSSTGNIFWPTINEPGLMASWFLPNEIEYLNTNLDLKLWQGRFCFWIKNVQTTGPRVEGIVRAPIVPINSNLTASDPRVDFISEMNPSAQTAAWEVTLNPGQSKHYSYTYEWPLKSSGSSVSKQSNLQTTSTGSSDPETPVSVPTKSTGVPYGLLIVGAIVVVGGIVFARFLR
jgi:hypothetical protein